MRNLFGGGGGGVFPKVNLEKVMTSFMNGPYRARAHSYVS